ncbi:uncharacterized protein V6R79_026452 [Siganus canaliculatus]
MQAQHPELIMQPEPIVYLHRSVKFACSTTCRVRTRHFCRHYDKRRWEGSNVLGKYGGKGYPFMLILYLEKNVQKGLQAEEKLNSCVLQNEKVPQQILAAPEPQSKRCRRDSPLEDAILKKLKKDLEAEGEVSVVSRLQLNNPEKEEEHQEDQGRADKRANMADEPQRSETPGEERQDLDEEGGGEEVEDEDSTPHPPARPGIWTRLASYIFPVRLFFRDH